MVNKGLNKGEINNLFETMDANKKNKLSEFEYEQFYNLMIVDFEECDKNKDFVLGKEEVGDCLEGERLKEMKLKKEDAQMVMESVDKGGINDCLNLLDYLFLRRVKLGWEKCAAGMSLAQVYLPCALRIAIPHWIADQSIARQISDLSVVLKYGYQDKGNRNLDLITFIGMAHIYYYFIGFQIPIIDNIISKSDLIRAVDNQLVPTSLNIYLINELFQDQEQLSFYSFAASMFLYRAFKRHAIEDQNSLNEQEFLLHLDDPLFCKQLLYSIDSFYMPTEQELIEASDTSHPQNMTETQFFVSFLQTQYHHNSHKKFRKHKHSKNNNNNDDDGIPFQDSGIQNVPANPFNRKLIYNMFQHYDLPQMTLSNFILFYKLSYYFINFDTDYQGKINFYQMREVYANYQPFLPLTTTETQRMNEAIDLIGGIQFNVFDLKEFMGMFLYKEVFNIYRVPSFLSYVTEGNLIKGLTRLGLRVIEQVKVKSKQGSDPQTHAPLFNYFTAFRTALIDDIVANRIKTDANNKIWAEHAQKQLFNDN